MSNDAERFRVALRLLARERHEKSIIELPTAAVARLISDVSAAYPACRRAFDQEIDAPTTTVERDAVGQNLSDDVMKGFTADPRRARAPGRGSLRLHRIADQPRPAQGKHGRDAGGLCGA